MSAGAGISESAIIGTSGSTERRIEITIAPASAPRERREQRGHGERTLESCERTGRQVGRSVAPEAIDSCEQQDNRRQQRTEHERGVAHHGVSQADPDAQSAAVDEPQPDPGEGLKSRGRSRSRR